MERKLMKVDKNGTKYWNTYVVCDRCCGGSGIYRWGAIQTDGMGHVIGSTYAGTCFKCGGAGHVWEVQKEYTPEYRAKLDAANQKRKEKQRAKWEAERAEREKAWAEQRAKEAAERAKREAERLAEIERNRGHFVGEVGDKIEATVTLERTFQYKVPCYGAPWKMESMTGYVFKTDEGNTLIWKSAGLLHVKEYTEKGHWRDKKGKYEYVHPEEGTKIRIKATIKKHEEFNNVNQTVLTRCQWIR